MPVGVFCFEGILVTVGVKIKQAEMSEDLGSRKDLGDALLIERLGHFRTLESSPSEFQKKVRRAPMHEIKTPPTPVFCFQRWTSTSLLQHTPERRGQIFFASPSMG